MITHEHELILELCKFIKPDYERINYLISKPLNFPYVLGQILFHRMGGIAYYTLRECNLLGQVNREIRNTLKTIYNNAVIKTENMAIVLSEITELLHNVKFPFALLKGAYLISQYPIGLRTSNDIDILIHQENLDEIVRVLNSRGFKQGNIRNGVFTSSSRAEIISSRMNRGEIVPFIKLINLPEMEFLEIDINFSLDFKAKQEIDLVSDLLMNTKRVVKTKNGSLPTLSKTDFLIHLCCHLYKEASVYAWVEMTRDLSLYKFADIYMLINIWGNIDFFQDLQIRINSLNLQEKCYYAIFYTCELFGIKDDSVNHLLNAIKPQDLSYLKEIIQPDKNKLYRYKEDFADWVFLFDRKERLYEKS